jgi:hypothetical protein
VNDPDDFTARMRRARAELVAQIRAENWRRTLLRTGWRVVEASAEPPDARVSAEPRPG